MLPGGCDLDARIVGAGPEVFAGVGSVPAVGAPAELSHEREGAELVCAQRDGDLGIGGIELDEFDPGAFREGAGCGLDGAPDLVVAQWVRVGIDGGERGAGDERVVVGFFVELKDEAGSVREVLDG